jgi:hypothetical protein
MGETFIEESGISRSQRVSVNFLFDLVIVATPTCSYFAPYRPVNSRAHRILILRNVPAIDPNYRTVVLGEGNIIFNREVGASRQEREGYYYEALLRYQEGTPSRRHPAFVIPGAVLRAALTDIAQVVNDKRHQFELGQAVLFAWSFGRSSYRGRCAEKLKELVRDKSLRHVMTTYNPTMLAMVNSFHGLKSNRTKLDY